MLAAFRIYLSLMKLFSSLHLFICLNDNFEAKTFFNVGKSEAFRRLASSLLQTVS